MAIGLTLNELYTCNKSLEPNNKDNKNGSKQYKSQISAWIYV